MAARDTHFGEGPAACPFVALDSDRDRRLDEPDHRHRCYAEPEPAPRALAHQRAYCLSPNFPGCPIFQDWAVRAAARPAAATGAAAAGAMGAAAVAAGDDDVDSPPPPRPAPAWAAPPPWVGREDAGPAEPEQIGAFDAPAFVEPPADDEPPGPTSTARQRAAPEYPPPGSWPPAAAAAGGGTSAAQSSPDEIERLPSLPVDPSGDPVRDAEIEAERRRRLEQDRERRAEEERLRRAEDERRERERRAAAAAAVPPFLASRAAAEGSTADGPPPPPRSPMRSGPPDAPAPPPATMATPQVKREDLVPVWEREPIHAYPTLRSRFSMGGGGSSDVLGTLTGVLALLALVALVAFMVIAAPVLFGGGGGPGRTQAPGAVATPTSAAGQTVAPGATATPQPPPPTASPVAGPTPRTYTVRAGDTLFGIAEEFGLTVEQLLAANPDIVNADYVTIGQVIVIPESDSLPAGSSAAPATP